MMALRFVQLASVEDAIRTARAALQYELAYTRDDRSPEFLEHSEGILSRLEAMCGEIEHLREEDDAKRQEEQDRIDEKDRKEGRSPWVNY